MEVQVVRGPGGMFTGEEGVPRRGRSSGVGERVGGIRSGWRWRRGSVQVTEGPGGEAPRLARGPPKAGLAGSIYYYNDPLKRWRNLPD